MLIVHKAKLILSKIFPQLLLLIQEHWDILKNSTPYSDDFWVLSDHHIQYKKQVFKGEVLTLKTYPEKPEGIRQPRKIEFYRGEELVVDSKTFWV